MISTVTTSTITTVTTMATLGLEHIFGLAFVVTLIALLTTKELVNPSLSHSSQLVGKFLNVGIWPMVMTFAAIVAIKIMEVLT